MAAVRKAKPRRTNGAGVGFDFVETESLNDRQRLFVQFYLETMNGGEAARRAGYSPRAAYQTASLLLRNAKVRAAVDASMQARAMGVDEVLSRLTDIARLDFTGFTNDAGDLDLVEARRRGLLRFVKKLTMRTQCTRDGVTTTTRTVEIQDVQGALVKLGERHGLWRPAKDKADVGHPTLEDYLAKLDEREAQAAATLEEQEEEAAAAELARMRGGDDHGFDALASTPVRLRPR